MVVCEYDQVGKKTVHQLTMRFQMNEHATVGNRFLPHLTMRLQIYPSMVTWGIILFPT